MPVFFRTTGTVGGPAFLLRAGSPSVAPVRMPVVVAVVERPDGLVLIDTGWSRRTCAFPADDPGLVAAALLGLSVTPEDALASGYAPGDVRHVVATHLHADHVGGVVDFAGATVHVAERELQASTRGILGGYRGEPLPSERAQIHAVAGPPALGFAASEDLFGDGSVLLLDARGHTAGSVAVAVKLQAGWLVHAGDAAMFVEDFRADDGAPASAYARAMSWDLGAQRRSWAAMREAESTHGARIVVSHDPALFATLPTTRETAWPAAWDRRRGKR